jgi:hypothetical protein
MQSSPAQEKLRLFVTDSDSWEARGALGSGGGAGGAGYSAGARPQTAEIIKTVRERCAGITVTIDRDKADYVLTLDHEGGKNLVQRDNKWALSNRDGDVIGAGSTRSLGNAVKEACRVVRKDRPVAFTSTGDLQGPD